MDENKEIQTSEELETTVVEVNEKVKEKKKKKTKARKPKLIKNQALFKRGGFAIAITALVLASLILFNWLVATLADRFNLEYDMSTQKVNTMSDENIYYIENVESEIDIIVCADEDDYAEGGYMDYYAQYLHNATSENAEDYYKQTINLINKYPDYNDKITVRYVDPQTTEFTEITSKYSSDSLSYGDIIVSTKIKNDDGSETERHKRIGYTDIYYLSDESGYASMGYSSYTVSSNNIETALTSAIAYVATGVTKKVALLTGHSSYDYTATYTELLTNNNYVVETIEDKIITEISNDYDTIAIVGPSSDFLGSELDVIAEFLDNDGELGKGLIFFADANSPALPNLYDFLDQWGIDVREGLLFETDSQNHVTDDPTTMGIYPDVDSITADMYYCITGYNVPILESDPVDDGTTVTPIYATSETVVAAPVGSAVTWNDYTEDDMGTYYSVLQSKKTDYNDDNEEISSYVMAFSSVHYINSEWAEYTDLSNKDIALAITERSAGIEDTGISFIAKTITNESFADAINAAASNTIMIIFMILLPVAMIVIGIVIFIRRKNA